MTPQSLVTIFLFFLGMLVISFRTFLNKKLLFFFENLEFSFVTKRSTNKMIKNLINDLEKVTQEAESISSNYEIVELNDIKPADYEIAIFKVPSSNAKCTLEKILLLQTPFVTAYRRERAVLEPDAQKTFLDILTYKIAEKRDRTDIATKIKENVNGEGRTELFDLFEKIVDDRNKFECFRLELRRRSNQKRFKKQSHWKEISKFIKDLATGKFGVMAISSLVGDLNYYFNKFRTIINSKYSGVHNLSRGAKNNELNQQLKTKLAEELIGVVKNTSDDTVIWEHVETGKKTTGRLIVFEKYLVK